MVYGGTIRAGHALGKPRDIISAFQSYGEYLAGVITDDQRKRSSGIPARARARAAACTPRNTMAVAIEALGLSLAVQFVNTGGGSCQGRRVPARGCAGACCSSAISSRATS
jgi:dihydroxyacid dehydratase/phosphogluconate dehydratase